MPSIPLELIIIITVLTGTIWFIAWEPKKPEKPFHDRQEYSFEIITKPHPESLLDGLKHSFSEGGSVFFHQYRCQVT